VVKAGKRNKARKRNNSRTLDPRVLKRLRSEGLDIGEAARWLTTELWDGKIPLLADGIAVQAAGFVEVVAVCPSKGQPSLQIWPRQALTIDPKKWSIVHERFEERLRAAKPPAPRPAKDIKLAPGGKRGKKVKFHWDLLVAEVIRRVHEEGIEALANASNVATELRTYCFETLRLKDEEVPGIEAIRKKLRAWLSRYPREN
jgi:hypothetical protein